MVLIIAFGFPIALILAWAFELTPEGLKRTEFADEFPRRSGHRRAWIYVVIIAGAISVSLFFLGRHTASFRVGAQQTELELTYGKIRSQAQKITKPDGKFEVRTPAGVAGVVGTDFFTGFDNSTGTMNVIVFEGIVKVCNLAGVCVIVKAGQMTSVRSNDSTGPLAPTQATLDVLVDAGTTTDVGGKVGVQNVGHHIGKGTAITLGILAVIPAILIPVVATHGNSSAPPNTTCKPNSQSCG